MILAFIILALLLVVTAGKHYTFSDADILNVVEKYHDVVNKYLPFYPQLKPEIILAMILVESNGEPSTIGDNGNSYGLMQVQQAALSDFNNFYGRNYNLQMLSDQWLGVEVGMGYLNLRLYKWIDIYTALRAYNQGDDGKESSEAYEYQEKVTEASKLIYGKLS